MPAFQDELLRQAKDAGKIERAFQLPKAARDNTPDALERALKPAVDAGLLPLFPFGTDFTAVEQRLVPALEALQAASPGERMRMLLRGQFGARSTHEGCLERMGLAHPKGIGERLLAAAVRGALARVS
jgi:hypothetical protein